MVEFDIRKHILVFTISFSKATDRAAQSPRPCPLCLLTWICRIIVVQYAPVVFFSRSLWGFHLPPVRQPPLLFSIVRAVIIFTLGFVVTDGGGMGCLKEKDPWQNSLPFVKSPYVFFSLPFFIAQVRGLFRTLNTWPGFFSVFHAGYCLLDVMVVCASRDADQLIDINVLWRHDDNQCNRQREWLVGWSIRCWQVDAYTSYCPRRLEWAVITSRSLSYFIFSESHGFRLFPMHCVFCMVSRWLDYK